MPPNARTGSEKRGTDKGNFQNSKTARMHAAMKELV